MEEREKVKISFQSRHVFLKIGKSRKIKSYKQYRYLLLGQRSYLGREELEIISIVYQVQLRIFQEGNNNRVSNVTCMEQIGSRFGRVVDLLIRQGEWALLYNEGSKEKYGEYSKEGDGAVNKGEGVGDKQRDSKDMRGREEGMGEENRETIDAIREGGGNSEKKGLREEQGEKYKKGRMTGDREKGEEEQIGEKRDQDKQRTVEVMSYGGQKEGRDSKDSNNKEEDSGIEKKRKAIEEAVEHRRSRVDSIINIRETRGSQAIAEKRDEEERHNQKIIEKDGVQEGKESSKSIGVEDGTNIERASGSDSSSIDLLDRSILDNYMAHIIERRDIMEGVEIGGHRVEMESYKKHDIGCNTFREETGSEENGDISIRVRLEESRLVGVGGEKSIDKKQGRTAQGDTIISKYEQARLEEETDNESIDLIDKGMLEECLKQAKGRGQIESRNVASDAEMEKTKHGNQQPEETVCMIENKIERGMLQVGNGIREDEGKAERQVEVRGQYEKRVVGGRSDVGQEERRDNKSTYSKGEDSITERRRGTTEEVAEDRRNRVESISNKREAIVNIDTTHTLVEKREGEEKQGQEIIEKKLTVREKDSRKSIRVENALDECSSDISSIDLLDRSTLDNYMTYITERRDIMKDAEIRGYREEIVSYKKNKEGCNDVSEEIRIEEKGREKVGEEKDSDSEPADLIDRRSLDECVRQAIEQKEERKEEKNVEELVVSIESQIGRIRIMERLEGVGLDNNISELGGRNATERESIKVEREGREVVGGEKGIDNKKGTVTQRETGGWNCKQASLGEDTDNESIELVDKRMLEECLEQARGRQQIESENEVSSVEMETAKYRGQRLEQGVSMIRKKKGRRMGQVEIRTRDDVGEVEEQISSDNQRKGQRVEDEGRKEIEIIGDVRIRRSIQEESGGRRRSYLSHGERKRVVSQGREREVGGSLQGRRTLGSKEEVRKVNQLQEASQTSGLERNIRSTVEISESNVEGGKHSRSNSTTSSIAALFREERLEREGKKVGDKKVTRRRVWERWKGVVRGMVRRDVKRRKKIERETVKEREENRLVFDYTSNRLSLGEIKILEKGEGFCVVDYKIDEDRSKVDIYNFQHRLRLHEVFRDPGNREDNEEAVCTPARGMTNIRRGQGRRSVLQTGSRNSVATDRRRGTVSRLDTGRDTTRRESAICSQRRRDSPIEEGEESRKVKGRRLPSIYDPDSQNRNLNRYNRCIQEEIMLGLEKKVKFRDNITKVEREALKTLKNRIEAKEIIITRADKGSGLVAVDYDTYISKGTKYIVEEAGAYTITQEAERDIVHRLKKERDKIVEQLKEKGVISVMTATYIKKQLEEKITGIKFYYKIHKDTNIDTMPLRPLQSCIKAPTQHLSIVLTDILQPLLTDRNIPSFIFDSNQLLYRLRNLGRIPDNCTLVSSDVSALYPSIPHREGFRAMKEFLGEKTSYNIVQINTIIKALELVITENFMTWNRQIYKQTSGVAMGTPVAVAYANIFMNWVDREVRKEAPYIHEHIRYIDDNLFIIPEDRIEELIGIANSVLPPHIKFTYEKLGGEADKGLPFLDTQLFISEDKTIESRLYTKKTDRHAYLLPSSYHPPHITQNIPLAVFGRLRKICSREEWFREDAEKAVGWLLNRGYDRKEIQKAVGKSSLRDRWVMIEQIEKKRDINSQKVGGEVVDIPLIITYNQHGGSIKKILKDRQPLLDSAFRRTRVRPRLSYRRRKNLNDMVVQKGLRGPIEDNRKELNIFSKCGERPGYRTRCPCKGKHSHEVCRCCTHSKGEMEGVESIIRKPVNCNTKNIVYAIGCRECTKIYIGETQQRIKDRLAQHIYNVDKLNQPLYLHFRYVHNLENLYVVILETVNGNEPFMRKVREAWWINKLRTLEPRGFNIKLECNQVYESID